MVPHDEGHPADTPEDSERNQDGVQHVYHCNTGEGIGQVDGPGRPGLMCEQEGGRATPDPGRPRMRTLPVQRVYYKPTGDSTPYAQRPREIGFPGSRAPTNFASNCILTDRQLERKMQILLCKHTDLRTLLRDGVSLGLAQEASARGVGRGEALRNRGSFFRARGRNP
jgi:hypothetical protein